jgi:hypothetical protein
MLTTPSDPQLSMGRAPESMGMELGSRYTLKNMTYQSSPVVDTDAQFTAMPTQSA